MKLKAPYLYGLRECGKGISAGYAAVLLGNFVVALISLVITRGTHVADFVRGMLLGLNIVNLSWIFMLMFGIFTYKQYLLFFVQNGRRRNTVFISCLAVFVTLALLLSFVNMGVDSFRPGAASIYSLLMKTPIGFSFTRFAWEFVMLLCTALLGMFCVTVFVRTTNIWRIVLGIGIPVTLFVILPTILRLIPFGGKSALDKLLDLLLAVLGFSGQGWNPWVMTLSMSIVGAVFCGGMHLMMRNAVIRK